MGKVRRVDGRDLLNAGPRRHWPALDKAMSALELGDNQRAVGLAARIVSASDDPAAEYILGRALYRIVMLSAAKDAILKSESMQPMSAFRCWTALQIGLILGDKVV